jgi:hypothetical protein
MAAKKLNKGVTCTVGAAVAPGVVELLAPGMMVYVTSETKVEPGTELQPGHKVLVDYRLEVHQFEGARGLLALRVRSYAPDPEDVRQLEDLLGRLARAGLSDPGFGPAAAFLQTLFDRRLRLGTMGPLDLQEELVKLLTQQQRRFPTDSWQHDVEPAVSDMEEKLRAVGVTAAIPRAPIEASFEAHADVDEEQVARQHFCAAIAQAANELLEAAGHEARWFQFKDLPFEDDEPFWLLVTPRQRDGLVKERVFEAR